MEPVAQAGPADAEALAALAAETFPLACPPGIPPAAIAAFVAEHLSAQRFAGYLDSADHTVLLARDDGAVIGYSLLIRGEPADPAVARAVSGRPAMELSKMYVRPDAHGSGVAAALMAAALDRARADQIATVWLGVNQRNTRAQAFYRKSGFTACGERTFTLADHVVEQDYVMARPA